MSDSVIDVGRPVQHRPSRGDELVVASGMVAPGVHVAPGTSVDGLLHTPQRVVGQRGLWAATRAQLACKRALDLVGALVLLVLLAPLVLVAVLLVAVTSAGPPIFVQRRVGQHGREFRMYKLRTMYRDAEARKAELEDLDVTGGPTFKMHHDPRITPVGRWLRAFSIDELPQLVNVLKGDMSLVGPRPALACEVAEYSDFARTRLDARPGLTCLWQVNGRSDLDFDTWMQLDVEYIRTWSLWLDVRLVLATIPAVLLRRGAY